MKSALLTFLALCCAAPVAAQDPTLERVQNLAATGRFTEARTTLDQWERQFADPTSSASAADRARAAFLRGTLTTEPKAAEEIYLNVVLSYPSSDVAPHALLRLGQGLLGTGEPDRAVTYLERLRRDYPGSSARETGWLWLARAHHAAGAPAAACNAARDGLNATRSDNLRTLLELERDRVCNGAAARPVSTPATPPGQSTAAPAHARFALQAGAFRERASADRIAAQLRARGFDARVVTTEDTSLFRVRHGFFQSTTDANDALRRIRDAGFTAIIVTDVGSEHSR